MGTDDASACQCDPLLADLQTCTHGPDTSFREIVKRFESITIQCDDGTELPAGAKEEFLLAIRVEEFEKRLEEEMRERKYDEGGLRINTGKLFTAEMENKFINYMGALTPGLLRCPHSRNQNADAVEKAIAPSKKQEIEE